MGTWTTALFDDDTTLDFAAEVAEAGSLEPVIETLADGDEDYIDATVGAAAIVSAVVVLTQRGVIRGEELPEDLNAAKVATPTADEIEAIAQTLHRLLDPEVSELCELWQEAGEEDFEQWSAQIVRLQNALPAEA